MKKLVSLLIICTLLLSAFGCSGNDSTASGQNKLKIVTTIFPAYDWAKSILGDNNKEAELTLLCDRGVDIHSYQPSVDDIIKISNCDIFIYVGGESEGWVDDALKSAKNDKMSVIDLMKLLGNSVKEEEIVEGMQAEEEESDSTEAPEYDEHVWLSIKNALVFCNGINEAIAAQRPDLKEACTKNLEGYTEKLKALDTRFTEMIQNSKRDTLIFGDRFPFRYFVDDYGLKYYAAFVGCSAESEASFETISFLADKLNTTGAKSIITLEASDNKLAETIIETSGNTGITIVKLDSMQSITEQKINEGAAYLTIMENNLENIRTALAE